MNIRFTLILLLIFITGCKETGDNNEKTIQAKQNRIENSNPKIGKKKDNLKKITRENAIDFLMKYGDEHPESLILMRTRLGDMKIKLYKDTPLHRASFIFLAKQGYFDTTCFYRVVKGFIIQGGNSENLSTMRFRNQFHNYFVPAEFRKNHTHKFGALAAARDWENNPSKKSTPFEFYIVQDHKGAHHLDGEHTVFGEVISGFKTIDKIAALKTGNDEWPIDDVFIKIEILE